MGPITAAHVMNAHTSYYRPVHMDFAVWKQQKHSSVNTNMQGGRDEAERERKLSTSAGHDEAWRPAPPGLGRSAMQRTAPPGLGSAPGDPLERPWGAGERLTECNVQQSCMRLHLAFPFPSSTSTYPHPNSLQCLVPA